MSFLRRGWEVRASEWCMGVVAKVEGESCVWVGLRLRTKGNQRVHPQWQVGGRKLS